MPYTPGRAYTVVRTTDETTSTIIGCDPLDAVCGFLQERRELDTIIHGQRLHAVTVGDIGHVDVCDRARPSAAMRNPWPEAGAIRICVALWWHGHPEVSVKA